MNKLVQGYLADVDTTVDPDWEYSGVVRRLDAIQDALEDVLQFQDPKTTVLMLNVSQINGTLMEIINVGNDANLRTVPGNLKRMEEIAKDAEKGSCDADMTDIIKALKLLVISAKEVLPT